MSTHIGDRLTRRRGENAPTTDDFPDQVVVVGVDGANWVLQDAAQEQSPFTLDAHDALHAYAIDRAPPVIDELKSWQTVPDRFLPKPDAPPPPKMVPPEYHFDPEFAKRWDAEHGDD